MEYALKVDTTAFTIWLNTTILAACLENNLVSDINNKKVVFKINAKTVQDANGKIIYAKVINGTVGVEYTIPENMKTSNDTITAILYLLIIQN